MAIDQEQNFDNNAFEGFECTPAVEEQGNAEDFDEKHIRQIENEINELYLGAFEGYQSSLDESAEKISQRSDNKSFQVDNLQAHIDYLHKISSENANAVKGAIVNLKDLINYYSEKTKVADANEKVSLYAKIKEAKKLVEIFYESLTKAGGSKDRYVELVKEAPDVFEENKEVANEDEQEVVVLENRENEENNYFQDVQTEEELVEMINSRNDWVNKGGKPQENDNLESRAKAIIKNGKGSIPTVEGLRDAALRVHANSQKNSDDQNIATEHDIETEDTVESENERDKELDEIVKMSPEDIAKKYLTYNDVLKKPEDQIDISYPNTLEYAQSLKELAENDELFNVAKKVKSDYEDVMRKLNIDSTDHGKSNSWVYWDLAKQNYYNSNKDLADNDYLIDDPLESLDLQKQISDRQLGWEFYGACQHYPEIALNSLNKDHESMQKISNLIKMEPNEMNSLSSKNLSMLGSCLRENIDSVGFEEEEKINLSEEEIVEEIDKKLQDVEAGDELGKKVVQEVSNMSPEEKRRFAEWAGDAGYLTNELKSGFMEKMLSGVGKVVRGEKSKKYFSKFADIFKNDKEKAHELRTTKGKSKMSRLSGVAQGVGNSLRIGRALYDFTGASAVNPLRYFTAASMFGGKALEAAKETRLDNEKLLEKTRIKDYEEAYEMATKYYDPYTRGTREDIEKSYMESVPEDLKKRLERLASKEYSGLKWLTFLIDKDVKIYLTHIDKMLQNVDKNYTNPEENKREKDNILKKREGIIRDLDRMLTREGDLDALAYISRLSEKGVKSAANAIMLDTGFRLWSSASDYFEKFSINNLLESSSDSVENKHPMSRGEDKAEVLESEKARAGSDHSNEGKDQGVSDEALERLEKNKGAERLINTSDESWDRSSRYREMKDMITQEHGPNLEGQGKIEGINQEQIQNAIIEKGKGIEHVLIKQLKADPAKFGFIGETHDTERVRGWAEGRAHMIAIKTGYVDIATGHEVRVGSSGVDKVAYVLKNDNNNIVVEEYIKTDKGFVSKELHSVGDEYEGTNKSNLESYEYDEPPKSSEVEPASEAVEEAVVEEKTTEYIPTEEAIEQVSANTNKIYNKGSFWRDQTEEWQHNKELLAKDVIDGRYFYKDRTVDDLGPSRMGHSGGEEAQEYNTEPKRDPRKFLGDRLDLAELTNRRELTEYLKQAQESIGPPRNGEIVESYLNRFEGTSMGQISGETSRRLDASGLNLSEGSSEASAYNSNDNEEVKSLTESYSGLSQNSNEALHEIRELVNKSESVSDVRLVEKMFGGEHLKKYLESLPGGNNTVYVDSPPGKDEMYVHLDKGKLIVIKNNGDILAINPSLNGDPSRSLKWEPKGNNKQISPGNIEKAFQHLMSTPINSNTSLDNTSLENNQEEIPEQEKVNVEPISETTLDKNKNPWGADIKFESSLVKELGDRNVLPVDGGISVGGKITTFPEKGFDFQKANFSKGARGNIIIEFSKENGSQPETMYIDKEGEVDFVSSSSS